MAARFAVGGGCCNLGGGWVLVSCLGCAFEFCCAICVLWCAICVSCGLGWFGLCLLVVGVVLRLMRWGGLGVVLFRVVWV